MTPKRGVAWPRRGDVRDALGPLWRSGDIEVLQLTVEHAFRPGFDDGFAVPLDEAAARGDLVGHAVYGCPYVWPPDRMGRDWLARTREVLQRWPVRYLVDHVGCCRVGGWNAAPIPLPASKALVRAVRSHLAWVGDCLEVRTGLENLALAASLDDVLIQPDLVEAMLAPTDGVLLLDLHNLWCQAVNYDLDPVDLMGRWPLDRVVQLHVAGGRWMDHPAGRFRRDTHDGPVPDEVYALIPHAIERCANLECVVFERLRGTNIDPDTLREEVLAIDVEVPRGEWSRVPRDVSWRTEAPAIAGDLFTAIRNGDRDAVERLAPGWWSDDRSWTVARDVLERWGHAVPV